MQRHLACQLMVNVHHCVACSDAGPAHARHMLDLAPMAPCIVDPPARHIVHLLVLPWKLPPCAITQGGALDFRTDRLLSCLELARHAEANCHVAGWTGAHLSTMAYCERKLVLIGKAAAMRFHAAPMSKGLLAAAAATTPAQHPCQLRNTASTLSQYMQLIMMHAHVCLPSGCTTTQGVTFDRPAACQMFP